MAIAVLTADLIMSQSAFFNFPTALISGDKVEKHRVKLGLILDRQIAFDWNAARLR
jgi:hypothetical protein